MGQQKCVILGLSWGYRKEKENILTPGLSNKALAKLVDLYQAETPGLESVLQWEIAECATHKAVLIIREHRIKGQYLDSDEVIDQALQYIKRKGYKEVILVAQSFLHRFFCKRLIKKMDPGLKVITPKAKVPFDRESAQWFARSRLNAVLYAFLRAVTGRRWH